MTKREAAKFVFDNIFARIVCSELEFLASAYFIITLLRFHLIGNRIRLLVISSLLTAISYIMQNVIGIGLLSAPAILIIETVLLVILFRITIGITLTMTLITTLLGVIGENVSAKILGSLSLINPNPREATLSDGNIVVLVTTLFILLITIVIKKRNIGPHYTRFELYGNALRGKTQATISSFFVLILLVLVLAEYYLTHPPYFFVEITTIAILVILLLLLITFSYRTNIKQLNQKYNILNSKHNKNNEKENLYR